MSSLYVEQFQVLQARPRVSGSRIGSILAIEGGPVVDFPGNPLGPQPARIVASLTEEKVAAAYAANLPVLLVFENDDPSRPVVIDLVMDQLLSETLDGFPRSASGHHAAVARTEARSETAVATAELARIVGVDAEAVLVESSAEAAAPTLAARTAITLRNLKDPVILLRFADGSAVIVGQVYPRVPIEAEGGAGAEVLLRGSRVTIEADVELILAAGACRVRLDARGKALTTADQIVSRARGANKVQGGTVQLN